MDNARVPARRAAHVERLIEPVIFGSCWLLALMDRIPGRDHWPGPPPWGEAAQDSG